MTNEEPEEIDWDALEHLANTGGDPEDYHEGHKVQKISSDMLLRRIMWNVVPCPEAEEVALLLGLNPTSDDVTEMDHEESHTRLRLVAAILPLVSALSEHASNSIVAATMVATGQVDAPEEAMEDAVEKVTPMIFQSAWAILAELLDLGVLHMPHHSNVFLVEGEM